MNDFDYDVLQKKKLAHNAIYKKNGSKSRKMHTAAGSHDGGGAEKEKRDNGNIQHFKAYEVGRVQGDAE